MTGEATETKSGEQQGRNRTSNSSATWSIHQNTSLFSPVLPLAFVKTFEQCQKKHFAKSERQGWLRSAVGERLKASHRRCHFPNQQQHMMAESLHCPLTPVLQCSQCLEKLKRPSSSQHVLSSHHSGSLPPSSSV